MVANPHNRNATRLPKRIRSHSLPSMDRLEPANKPRPAHDWEQAKAIFLAGHSVAKVSEMTGIPIGTVKAYAYRHRWDSIRAKTLPKILEARITTTKAYATGLHDGIEQEGRKVRTLLSKAVSRQVERIADADPETLRDELDVATILQKAAGVASTTYGWDRESVSTSVRIGAMGEVDELGEGPTVDAQ